MTNVETWKQEIKNKKFDRAQKMGKVYVKKKRLGRGAFGEGWLCADQKHKRLVVVKIANGAMFSARDEFNAKKEVALMESLDHPNIVKFHEAWIEGAEGLDERLHIAMEYCDAGDLGTLLRARLADERNVALLAKVSSQTRRACEPLLEGKRMEDLLANKELFVSTHTQITQIAETAYANAVETEGRINTWSLPELESWMVQLLWGLWYIHKKRVVHRDIKPENIFLSGGGKIIKIGDFGISGLQSHTNANLNTRAGTPLYMAPEMWDNGTYTDRVDVFALGAMFYELCGLVRAYDARFPTAERWAGSFGQQSVKFLKRQIVYSAIRPMALPQTQIESSFFEVVRTMTRKSADIRPTAGQVLRSIRIQLVARRVIDVFSAEGEGCPSAHPLLMNSDARHHNVHNPADNQYTLHDTARFQCSVPDAEVLIVTSNVRVSIRAEASSASPILGFLFSGDIIEVHERQSVEGTEWVRFQNGWCVSEHDGQPLTGPCPEDLLSRDPEGIKALGAYEDVVNDVKALLQDALRNKKAQQEHPSPSQQTDSKRREKARSRSPPRSPISPISPRVPPPPSPPAAKHQREAPRSNKRSPSPPGGKQPATPQARSPSPPAPAKRNPSTSPVVRRLTSPTRKTPPSPVRNKSPTANPDKRDKASSERRKDDGSVARKRLKDKVVAALGRDVAKKLFQEYYDMYGACVRKGFMAVGGTCKELQNFELATKLKLGNDGYVVQYIRECAHLHFAASAGSKNAA